jgi:hypothetical protein
VKITNSFFNAWVPGDCAIVYTLPMSKVTRCGYAFAEFEAARSAINGAFAQANWDGYGALPVSTEIKSNALEVLSHLENLTCAPEITPNPNGTLSFEWESNQGFGVIEIGRTRYSYYVHAHCGSPFLGAGNAEEVNPAVGLLVDALLFPKPSQSLTLPAL